MKFDENLPSSHKQIIATKFTVNLGTFFRRRKVKGITVPKRQINNFAAGNISGLTESVMTKKITIVYFEGNFAEWRSRRI